MFDQITEKFNDITNRLRGRAHITEGNLEEVLREIRIAMLEADVALPVVRDFLAQVKTEALGQQVLKSLTPGQTFIGIFHQQLQKTLEDTNEKPWHLRTASPSIILMAGLQGVGKTTQSAKIAQWYHKQKKKVLLVSCDTYRPAAVEQLRTLAKQIEIDFWEPSGDALSNAHEKLLPEKIAEAALIEAKQKLYDVLIVDTAGRLSIDDVMMHELQGLATLLHPDETWLVVDAMQGQDALNTAKVFSEHVSITGLVMTKTDGDARGGAILSARMVTGAPIRFMGTSEKIDGLELFDARRIADRILGMGDMVGLFEDAASKIDAQAVQKFSQKIKKGKGFTLGDFRDQLSQMRNMGGLDALMDKMPLQVRQMAQKVPQQFSDGQLVRMMGVIDSMTPRERRFPDLIKASRKKRIAGGSGTTVQEVNKLLNQFQQMEKLGKKFKGKGMEGLSHLMGSGGAGGLPGSLNKGMGAFSQMLNQLKR